MYLTRSTLALCLALGVGLLTGCGGGIPINLSVDCAFAKRLDMSEETLAWFAKDGEPPAYVQADMEKVAKLNDKILAICPK